MPLECTLKWYTRPLGGAEHNVRQRWGAPGGPGVVRGADWLRGANARVGQRSLGVAKPQRSTRGGVPTKAAVVRGGVTRVADQPLGGNTRMRRTCVMRQSPLVGAEDSDVLAFVGRGRAFLVGWSPQERRGGFCGRSSVRDIFAFWDAVTPLWRITPLDYVGSGEVWLG
jgi:hypothetical protein